MPFVEIDMRAALLLAAFALMVPAASNARDDDSGRYGPMDGRGDGYKSKIAKDGFWEITGGVSGYSRATAADFAIYRAAEMARAEGHRYVEIHDAVGRQNRSTGAESVTLFARPIDAPIHPSACRSGKPKRCYTADVALVFARLSGEDGNHPGVAAPSYIDKFGRTVTQSGFGTGAVGVPPQ
jgi:hypothetical protein